LVLSITLTKVDIIFLSPLILMELLHQFGMIYNLIDYQDER